MGWEPSPSVLLKQTPRVMSLNRRGIITHTLKRAKKVSGGAHQSFVITAGFFHLAQLHPHISAPFFPFFPIWICVETEIVLSWMGQGLVQ